jgi:DNA segregation ATPase FtsK/SpoIIIE-like protein
MIDEVDAVASDPECKALLAKIASKCRSEGVALIIAGQRATVQ